MLKKYFGKTEQEIEAIINSPLQSITCVCGFKRWQHPGFGFSVHPIKTYRWLHTFVVQCYNFQPATEDNVDEKVKALIDAIQAYMSFHGLSYESPMMAEARRSVEKAIKDLRTEN